MLSRARALLQAHPGNGRIIVRSQWGTLSRRSYAAGGALESQRGQDNLQRKRNGNIAEEEQNKHLTRNLIRRVSINERTLDEPRSPKNTPARHHAKDSTPGAASALPVNKNQDTAQDKQVVVKTRWAERPLRYDMAFGTITTSRPSETKIDELVEEIQPMRAKVPSDRENPAIFVLLMTPTFAQHALDDHLPKAVFERLQLRKKPYVSYQFTSAVVDRLPTTPDEVEGAEGLAYMLLRNPPVADPADQTPLQQSAQKPGSLTFRKPYVFRANKKIQWNDYELQLPLCQTVFSTGLVSTMVQREYAWDNQDHGLKLIGERKLESQILQLPVFPTASSKLIVRLPLVPLTPFRKIDYAMGNIIRKLSSQPTWDIKPVEDGKPALSALVERTEGEKQDMPASQELEDAVSRYFEALDLPPETVSVWALVVPRSADMSDGGRDLACLGFHGLLTADKEAISAAWHPKAPAAAQMSSELHQLVRRLVSRGARLTKVLSGGGGWGKKAGLLSLDPDVQYSTRELRQDEGWQFNFDNFDDGSEAAAEAQKKQALGQIVKEGESVMFLLAPKEENLPQPVHSHKKHLSSLAWQDKTKQLDFSFGVIPSSIDVVPQNADFDSSKAVIKHYPGCFGMLSEGGMAVTIIDRKRETGSKRSSGGQTKLDIPFGRFNFQQYEDFYHPNAWANLSATKGTGNGGTAGTEAAHEYTRKIARVNQSGDEGISGAEADQESARKIARVNRTRKKNEGRKQAKAAKKQSEGKDEAGFFEKMAEYNEADTTSMSADTHKSEQQSDDKPL